MITNFLNQYQIKRTWDIILVLSSQRLPMDRALGMLWSVGLDCFGFPNVLKDQSLTTRRVFAMVFRAKKVLLATFSRDVGWYEPRPKEILPRWEWWERDLLCLKHLQIPRCFEAKTMSHKKTYEFHIFADASTFGCIQCFHLTVQN